MISTVNRIPDSTVELTITVPWTDVNKTYETVVSEAVKNAEVSGFRKGKAPRDIVEKNLDKTKLYEEVLKILIPQSYNQAVTEHKLTPIISPKVELKEANEGKDWVIRVLTCEKPPVTLGDYTKAIRDLKARLDSARLASKGKKIWTPGTDLSAQAGPKKDEANQGAGGQKPTLDELLHALYSAVTMTLPALLIEHEANRLLSDLIDQTKKLGLSVEQYLASTNRTADSVRHEYEEQAKRTLTLEFALEEIADKEGILVSDDDIDAVINTAKSDEEKKALTSQRYYLASILRRQKTLDTLAAL